VTEPLLRVEGLSKYFPVTRGVLREKVGEVRAVDGVSFEIAPGETLGLVGESGSGKTTVGRCVLRLMDATAGRVTFDGTDVTAASPKELATLRRHFQIVFQDPYSSLNPRMRVADIIGEALEVYGIAKGRALEHEVQALMRRVGLSPEWMNRYPHEFSGGQRQRIGVARAIALGPKLIVCDEAVSALDVSIQAQVINLLVDLRREMGLSYLFIAHDLSVVRHISNRVAVMYLGQIVEVAPSERIFSAPAHPYTRALLSAIPSPTPSPNKRRIVLHGDVPTPLNPPSGCRFHTRCPAVFERCRTEDPLPVTVEPGHTVKCFHSYDLDEGDDWSRVVSERIERAMQENAPALAKSAMDEAVRATLARSTAVRRAPRIASAAQRTTNEETPLSGWGALVRFSIFLVLVGLSWFAVRGSDFARRRKASKELSALTQALDERATITGAYPRDLDELGFRLFPIFEDGNPVDPWGRRFRYRTTGDDGRAFELKSLGPDGVVSGDDVDLGSSKMRAAPSDPARR
jgi:oligopeptide/dipeptide ABC transporter ATP-binding protein